MLIKLRRNLSSGVLSITIGVALYALIPYCITTKRQIQTAAIGSDYLPRLVAVLLVIMGLFMAVQSLVFKKDTVAVINLKEELRIFALMGILIAYSIAVMFTGFLIASIIALGFMLLLLKCRKWHYYLIIAVLTAFVYFSFRYGLNIRLP
jgi:hypothetical protein